MLFVLPVVKATAITGIFNYTGNSTSTEVSNRSLADSSSFLTSSFKSVYSLNVSHKSSDEPSKTENVTNIFHPSSVISTEVPVEFNSTVTPIIAYSSSLVSVTGHAHPSFSVNNVSTSQVLISKNLTDRITSMSTSLVDSSDVRSSVGSSNFTNPQYPSNQISSARPIFGPKILEASVCSSGTSQVTENIQSGYKNDGYTRDSGAIVDLLESLYQKLQSNSNDFTEFSSSGDNMCAVWSGAMLRNSELGSLFVVDVAAVGMHRDGVEVAKFYEHVDSGGDPMKTFGVICVTTGDMDYIYNTLKLWSVAQSATSPGGSSWDGTANEPSTTQCFLDYNARKSDNSITDPNIGTCKVGTINAGESATSVCNGINGESIQYYNPSVDFSMLQPGDEICCSAGSMPNLGYATTCDSGHTRIGTPSVLGWKYSGSYYSVDDASQALDNIINTYQQGWASNDFTEFSTSNGVMCMAYFGAMVSNSDTTQTFLNWFKQNLKQEGLPSTKYIESIGSNAMQTVGAICNAVGDKDIIEDAIKSWSKGESFTEHDGTSPKAGISSCYLSYADRKSNNAIVDPNIGQCDYSRISSGQTASSACNGLTGDVLSAYNKDLNLDNLAPNTPVCCSAGSPPNFMPSKNSDGSCYSHTFSSGETCAAVMAQYFPLSMDDLLNFNKDTFGWYGCDNGHPWVGDIICVSDGTPPRPAVNPEAECGPQAPGDLYNAPCPLNACCSEYGFCGLTSDFCGTKDSLTGAPGTAGCLSNCGSPSFKGPSGSFTRIGYYQGTDPASMNTVDINTFGDMYDIIHLAFGTISSDHSSLSVDNVLTEYQNMENIDAKKVISFGGWDFSTDPSTYMIFRDAIGGDPVGFASTVVQFFQQDENSFLDGIDFDWEYPGEPDIPGIPADDPKNGEKLLEFVTSLRTQMNAAGMQNKTISLAIPSSFWYLKPYPISDIVDVVDYVVFMTYDLHGQWDYSNQFSGGDHVFCHTNLTETFSALEMIVKAGVDSSKVIVGEANYARSYQLASGQSCNGAGCIFTGPSSGATPGNYSYVAGILTADDIASVQSSNSYHLIEDNNSECTIMIYNDNTEWAAWTTDNSVRDSMYQELGFGGSSMWSLNYNTSGLTTDGDDDEDDYYWFIPLDYSEDAAVVPYDPTRCGTGLDNVTSLENIDFYLARAVDEVTSEVAATCVNDFLLFYLINNSTAALASLKKLRNDDDGNSYTKNWNSYSDYFAHNFSMTYQDWAYANIDKDWFQCYDTNNVNLVSCSQVLDNGGSANGLCQNNCCHAVGCDSGVTCEAGSNASEAELEEYCCDVASDPSLYTKREDAYANGTNVSPILPQVVNTANLSQPVYDNILARNAMYLYNNPPYNFPFNEANTMSANESSPFGNVFKVDDHVTIYGWQLNPSQLSSSLPDFSNMIGYNVTPSSMYRQSYYVFQEYLGKDGLCFEDNKSHNITVRCFDLPYDRLFRTNPMDSITDDNITSIENLINTLRTSYNSVSDSPLDMYSSASTVLLGFTSMVENIQSINDFGHNYRTQCERRKLMKILGPLFDALVAVLGIFLGPEANLLLGVLDIAANSLISGHFDPLSLLSLADGDLLDIFKISKFASAGKFGKFASTLRPDTLKTLGNRVSILKNKADEWRISKFASKDAKSCPI